MTIFSILPNTQYLFQIPAQRPEIWGGELGQLYQPSAQMVLILSTLIG